MDKPLVIPPNDDDVCSTSDAEARMQVLLSEAHALLRRAQCLGQAFDLEFSFLRETVNPRTESLDSYPEPSVNEWNPSWGCTW